MTNQKNLPIRAVVFDVGKVLVPVGFSADCVVPILPGFEPTDEHMQRLSLAINTYRDEYDRGASLEWYWGNVLHDINNCYEHEQDGIDPALLKALDKEDQFRWSYLGDEMKQFVEDLNAHGIVTAICSNAPFSLAACMKANPWIQQHMQYTAFSSEVGVAKPDIAIYEHIYNELLTTIPELERQQVAFFDDREVNVQAAIKFGWQARVWSGNDDIASAKAWIM